MPDPSSQLYERDFAALARDMPDDKLHDTRRDLATGLGLLRPGSLMYAPAHEYLYAVDTELTHRARAGQPGTPGSLP
jgi:hypothetical protein